MKKSIFILSFLSLFASCSSVKDTHYILDEEAAKDKIIDRSDELNKRPEWVSESESYTLNAGNIFSLGMTTIKGDQQIDAAYRIAENNAKAVFAKAIEQKLEFFLQSAKEGMEIGSDVNRYISTEVSKLSTSGIIVSNKYWEKFITTDGQGLRVSRYRVFVRVMISENILKDQVYKALNKSSGVAQTVEFKKSLDKKWDELF